MTNTQPDTQGIDNGAFEQEARELLAKEYDSDYPSYAELARAGSGEFTRCSIRAIKKALRTHETSQLTTREGDEVIKRLRDENRHLRNALGDIMRSSHPNPSYIAKKALTSKSLAMPPSETDADANGDVLYLRSGAWECLGKWNKVPVDASSWRHTDRYRQALRPVTSDSVGD